MRTNCPNCGAPIESVKCSYCGTMLYDFTALELEHPGWVRLRCDNRIIQGMMVPTSCSITTHVDEYPRVTLDMLVLSNMEVIRDD